MKRKDIWYVDPAGENLELVVEDTKKVIQDVGLDWFSRFSDPKEVLRTPLIIGLGNQRERLWLWRKPLANERFYDRIYRALLGQNRGARERIKKALDSGRIREFQPNMHAALEELERNRLAGQRLMIKADAADAALRQPERLRYLPAR